MNASAPLPTYAWEPTNDFIAAKYGLPRDQIVRFDVNTSPTPPDFTDLLSSRFDPPLSEYPPSDYATLVVAAAGAYRVDEDEILPCAGADEALDLTARAFLREGSVAIGATPTYSMYQIVTEQRGARFQEIPRLSSDHHFGMDISAIVTAARLADLIWLCEPNNPTGAAEPPERVAELLDHIMIGARLSKRLPPIVVVDEAYAEFVGRSVLNLRQEYPRLVVIRTMSKAHALAGIRVGFAVARPDVLAPIVSFRAPASVSTVSATLATAALRRPELAAANVARINAQRTRLIAELSELGWHEYPSRTNFVLFAFTSPTAAANMAEGLLRRGLVPRTFDRSHAFASCLRLTVRSASENDRLVAAVREISA